MGPLLSRVVVAATAAPVVAVVAGLLGGCATPGADGRDGGSASCAGVVRWHGRDYLPASDVTRVPMRGRALGAAVRPACDDGGGAIAAVPVPVFAVPGIDDDSLLLDADGTVLAADGADASRPFTPPSVVEASVIAGDLLDAAACSGSGGSGGSGRSGEGPQARVAPTMSSTATEANTIAAPSGAPGPG